MEGLYSSLCTGLACVDFKELVTQMLLGLMGALLGALLLANVIVSI